MPSSVYDSIRLGMRVNVFGTNKINFTDVIVGNALSTPTQTRIGGQ